MTFYTDFFESKMDMFKLSFGKVFAIVMAIFCIYEIVKLATVKSLNLVINDDYISWGTTKLNHHIQWQSIKSLTMINKHNMRPTRYEFILKVPKIGVISSVINVNDYDFCEDEIMILMQEKSNIHRFTIFTL
jgi:hypothetical protein